MAKLSVYPRIASGPTTITLLLMEIPDGARVACFALDGTNYYGGCQDVQGRHSIQVQYKDARPGTYEAYATIDGKIVTRVTVTITGFGYEVEDP